MNFKPGPLTSFAQGDLDVDERLNAFKQLLLVHRRRRRARELH